METDMLLAIVHKLYNPVLLRMATPVCERKKGIHPCDKIMRKKSYESKDLLGAHRSVQLSFLLWACDDSDHGGQSTVTGN